MKAEASLAYDGGMIIALALSFALTALGQSKEGKPKDWDPKLPIARRVRYLIKRMTLEEKTDLNWIGNISSSSISVNANA